MAGCSWNELPCKSKGELLNQDLYPVVSTVKPVLSGHPWDPRFCSLNRGVRLVQVHFTENKGRKIGLYRGCKGAGVLYRGCKGLVSA